MPPSSSICPLLARGVYRAPVLGEHGEIVLFAVSSDHRFIEFGRVWVHNEREVRPTTDALWRLLDEVDPQDTILLSDFRRVG